MNTEVSQSNDWVQLQVNVFTRWVQNQLKGHSDIHIDKITKDLSNGVALVELAKTLTQKDTPRSWTESPKRTVDMVQNCDLAVDMFSKDGVNLVGISGKDVNDNNEKLILGLIWSLILHYSIGKSVHMNYDDGKHNVTEEKQNKVDKETKLLRSWAIDRTENYPNVHNFTPYELSMCALLDSYVPNKINYYSLNPNDTEHNSELATNVMQDLGIPILIYPDDIKNINSKVDDKTLLTQLSCMKSVLEESASHVLAENNNKHNDEKSDVDSDSEEAGPVGDDFGNTIIEDNEVDQESIIKADSANPSTSENGSNATNSLNNQHDNQNYDLSLFEKDSNDHGSNVNADEIQQNHQPEFKQELKQRDFELNQNDHVLNNDTYQLTDHLLDHDSKLKVDSREEKFMDNARYERLQDQTIRMPFFERFIERFIRPIEAFFNTPVEKGPKGRAILLNSPITPYYYYVDYNNQ